MLVVPVVSVLGEVVLVVELVFEFGLIVEVALPVVPVVPLPFTPVVFEAGEHPATLYWQLSVVPGVVDMLPGEAVVPVAVVPVVLVPMLPVVEVVPVPMPVVEPVVLVPILLVVPVVVAPVLGVLFVVWLEPGVMVLEGIVLEVPFWLPTVPV